jgi:hypothetical protein
MDADQKRNPRLVSRQTWWIEFGRWANGELPGPICTECADPMPDAPFTGHFVCEECEEFVAGMIGA